MCHTVQLMLYIFIVYAAHMYALLVCKVCLSLADAWHPPDDEPLALNSHW